MCHAQQWAASAHVAHCNCYWPQVAWCRVVAVAWPHGDDIGQREECRHSGLWSATTWAMVSRGARQWCEGGSENVERPRGEGGEDTRPQAGGARVARPWGEGNKAGGRERRAMRPFNGCVTRGLWGACALLKVFELATENTVSIQ